MPAELVVQGDRGMNHQRPELGPAVHAMLDRVLGERIERPAGRPELPRAERATPGRTVTTAGTSDHG